MDPIFIAVLATYGVDAVIQIIDAWKATGEPTAEEIWQAFIDKKPEDYFPKE